MSDDNDQPRSERADWITRGLVVMVALGLLFIVFSDRLKRDGAEGPPPPPPKSEVEVVADTVKDGAKALADIAEKFQKGRITETFMTYLPSVKSTGKGHLEVAVITVPEKFTRSDKKTIFWDKISLGTTVTEIEVPVTYRYHMKLKDEWKVEVNDQQVIVHAPAIYASQPPAIHTGKMRKRSDRGWARFNAGDQMEALMKSLTPRVKKHAVQPFRANLSREPGRQVVAEFVKDWLLKEENRAGHQFQSIVVLFPNEESTREPTLKLPLP